MKYGQKQYEQKDNTISLWPARERKHENSPHLTGKGRVDGRDCRVSAWEQDSHNPKAPVLKLTITFDGDGGEAPF